ncbi:MAG TPA: hypothetical protein VGE94_08930 [Chloroflexota bacterium]
MKRVVASLAAAVIGTLFVVSGAFADATPVQLVLLYLPNVSNTGTTAASGIAELVMPEGEVRITAADLPRLDGDKQYVAWVVNSETNEFERIGAFNTALSTSSVRYENVLPNAIPNKHWNLLLVTLEDGPEPARPSKKHSIAGVFPRADNEPLPGVLPNTGGLADGSVAPGDNRPDWLLASGLATLTTVVGFGAGYATGFRRR